MEHSSKRTDRNDRKLYEEHFFPCHSNPTTVQLRTFWQCKRCFSDTHRMFQYRSFFKTKKPFSNKRPTPILINYTEHSSKRTDRNDCKLYEEQFFPCQAIPTTVQLSKFWQCKRCFIDTQDDSISVIL